MERCGQRKPGRELVHHDGCRWPAALPFNWKNKEKASDQSTGGPGWTSRRQPCVPRPTGKRERQREPQAPAAQASRPRAEAPARQTRRRKPGSLLSRSARRASGFGRCPRARPNKAGARAHAPHARQIRASRGAATRWRTQKPGKKWPIADMPTVFASRENSEIDAKITFLSYDLKNAARLRKFGAGPRV